MMRPSPNPSVIPANAGIHPSLNPTAERMRPVVPNSGWILQASSVAMGWGEGDRRHDSGSSTTCVVMKSVLDTSPSVSAEFDWRPA